jgi:hypothetical protein
MIISQAALRAFVSPFATTSFIAAFLIVFLLRPYLTVTNSKVDLSERVVFGVLVGFFAAFLLRLIEFRPRRDTDCVYGVSIRDCVRSLQPRPSLKMNFFWCFSGVFLTRGRK